MRRLDGRWTAAIVFVAAALAGVTWTALEIWPRSESTALAVATFGLSVLVAGVAVVIHRHTTDMTRTLEANLSSHIDSRTERTERKVVREVGAVAGLLSLGDGQLFPALDGMSLSSRALHTYLQQLLEKDPRSALELGAGASTVFALALVQAAAVRTHVVAVDHDADHLKRVRVWCDHAGIDPGLASWVHAPLTRWDEQHEWYSVDALSQKGPFDLVLVDGPPNPRGDGQRTPALPALRPLLADRALLLVDDTDRDDESDMVDEWLRGDPDLRLVLREQRYCLLATGGREDGSN